MSQPAPTATGTLTATPLGHLLVHVLDRRLSGSLVFEEPDHRKHALYFVNGAPVAARTAGVLAQLGELAVEHSVLARERLDAALEAAQQANKRLGEQLLDWALLDEPALDELLREQVGRRVRALRELPAQTAYGYYDGTNFLERAGGPKQPPPALPLIWHVMRETPDHGRAAEAVARLGLSLLRFHVDAPLAHFELEPGERAVVDVLRAKPQPFDELAAREFVPPNELTRIVFTLLLLRQFDLGNGAVPVGAERRSLSPVGFGRVPAAPASGRAAPSSGAPVVDLPPKQAAAPADDPLRREAAERSAVLKQSYYEVLGVPIDAAGSAIAAAYFQLAKRWHPDRLGAEHADLRDVAARIFARIGEAHQVLADADQRGQYDQLLKQGEGDAEEQEQVQKMLRAATNFQKAQVMLRRNNLPGAEEAARAALADAPDEADHIALVAWLEASKPGADLEARLRELNRAAKMEDSNLRVRWYRGQVLKRLGRERQAIEDFRLIAERDPRHVDAQREIRLFEMQRGKRTSSDAPAGERRSELPGRSTTAPPTPSKAGFFGKLFKK